MFTLGYQGRETMKQNKQNGQGRSKRNQSTGRATISACLIVKNEEYFLPRCLSSIRDLVDEIILVDTGSDDRTVEIAEQFDCKIYHFPWTGDFSAARNESLKQATSDWILIIDADEEVPTDQIEGYREVVNRPNLEIVSLSVYNQSPETGDVSSFVTSVRLFRRSLNLNYQGIVHNRLKIPANRTKVRIDLKLYHYGYDLPRDKQDLKLERTRLLLEKQLQETPDDLFANFNMIQLLRSKKDADPEKANLRLIEHADMVLKNPEARQDMYYGHHLMTLYQKAASLALLRRFDEAEQCCRTALEIKPDYLDVLLTLGHILNNTERLDEARRLYCQFLDTQQNYNSENEVRAIVIHHLQNAHLAWFALGDIAEREAKTDEAIEYFLKTLESKEPFQNTYCRLGKLHLDREEWEKAEQWFTKEIGRDQSSALANFGLGSVFAGRRQFDESLKHFQRAVELDGDNSQMRFHWGRILILAGQIEEGRGKLIEVAEMSADNPGLLYETANLIFETGDFNAAAELYTKSIALRPDFAEAGNNLGNCYFKSGQYEAACAIYEQLLEKFPEYRAVYRSLGLSRIHLGQLEPARLDLEQYVKYNPEDIAVQRVLGDISFRLGHLDKSITWYEKYLISQPVDCEVLFSLAEVYRELGFVESAVLGYRRIVALHPEFEPAGKRLDELAAVTPSS